MNAIESASPAVNPRVNLRVNPRMAWRRRQQRGAAILMALITMMMMLALAVPFAVTMVAQEAGSQAYRGRLSARLGAESAANHLTAALRQNARELQFERWRTYLENTPTSLSASERQQYPLDSLADPFVDLTSELPSSPLRLMSQDFASLTSRFAPGQALPPGAKSNQIGLDDPRERILSAFASDEQGKIDINTATPTMLGNLMGSAIVGLDSSTSSIKVLDGIHHFPRANGMFVINGVLCRYRDSTSDEFTGVSVASVRHPLARGETDGNQYPPPFVDDPELAQRLIRMPGSMILPVAAWLIPYYRMIASQDEEPGRFATVDQIRAVAEFDLVDSNQDTIPPEVWKRIRPFLSAHTTSKFAGGFHLPHVVEQIRDADDRSPESSRPARVRRRVDGFMDKRYFLPSDPREGQTEFRIGSTLRFRFPNGDVRYGLALAGGLVTSGDAMTRVDNREDRPVAEIQAISPININTASYEVLVALFKGLGRGSQVVTELYASELAEMILGLREGRTSVRGRSLVTRFSVLAEQIKEPDDPEGGMDALRWGGVTSLQALTTLFRATSSISENQGGLPSWVANHTLNALQRPMHVDSDSHNPITFESRGVYRIEGLSSSFNRAGFETGRSRINRVVHVGTDALEQSERASWQWLDHRSQLEELAYGQGNWFTSRVAATHRRRTYGEMYVPFMLHPDAELAEGPDTLRLNGQRQTLRQRPLTAQSIMPNSAQLQDLRAGHIAFWYQIPGDLQSRDAAYIIDTAEGVAENQLSILWWDEPAVGVLASALPAIAIRLADRTKEEAYTVATCSLPPNRYPPGSWVHIRASWEGYDLSDLSLLIDGVADAGNGDSKVFHVTRNAQGAWVSRSGTLREDMPRDAAAIPLNRNEAQGFDPWGTVRIGDEFIDYDGIIGDDLEISWTWDAANNIRVPLRNRHGSFWSGRYQSEDPTQAEYRNREHAEGERVENPGYAAEAISHFQAPSPIPMGGGSLVSPLSGPGIFFVRNSPATPNAAYAVSDLAGPDAGIGKASSTIELDPSQDGPGSQAARSVLPNVGLLFVWGPAWQGYAPASGGTLLVPDADGNGTPDATYNATNDVLNIGGVGQQGEFIAFQRMSASSVRILQRFDLDMQPKDPSTYLHFFGSDGSTNVDPRLTGNQPYRISGSVCMLVSIEVNAGADYYNPQNWALNSIPIPANIANSGNAQLIEYTQRWYRKARVLLANPTPNQTSRKGWRDSSQVFIYDRVMQFGGSTLLCFAKEGDNYNVVQTGLWTTPGGGNERMLRADAQQAATTFVTFLTTPLPTGTNPYYSPPSACRERRPQFADAMGANFQSTCIDSPAGAFVNPVFAVNAPSVFEGDRVTMLRSPNRDKTDNRVGKVFRIEYSTGLGDYRRVQGYTTLGVAGQHVWVGLMQPLDFQYPVRDPGQDPNAGRPALAELIKFPSPPRPDNEAQSGLLPLQYAAQSQAPLMERIISTGFQPELTLGARDQRAGGGLRAGGEIDEVVTGTFDAQFARLVSPLSASEKTRLVVDWKGNFLPQSGMIKINDEYIYYRSLTAATVSRWEAYIMQQNPLQYDYRQVQHPAFELGDLTRGMLGTAQVAHGQRSSVMILRDFRAWSMVGGGSMDTNEVHITGNAPQPLNTGFLRIERGGDQDESQIELVGYTETRRQGGNTIIYTGDYRPLTEAPLFRGSYGTRIRDWSQRSGGGPVVTEFPVRQPDFMPRWMERVESKSTLSPEICYAQGSEQFNGADLRSLTWLMSTPEAAEIAQYMSARLVLTFNEEPHFGNDSSDKQEPYSWEFDFSTRTSEQLGSPQTITVLSNRIDLSRISPKRTYRLDWRLYYSFRDGAYEAGAWKQSMNFHGLRLELETQTRVLSHEEHR